jgi:hypothetical protein
MANPERVKHKGIKFSDVFSAFIALDEDEGKERYNYDGEVIRSKRGMIARMDEMLSPVFEKHPESSLANYGPRMREGKKKVIKEFLDKHLHPVEGQGTYMFMIVKHGDSSHVIALARPDGGKNEYHMFDPNIGHFKGKQVHCINWIRAMFMANFTSEAGYGDAYERTYIYIPEKAVVKKGMSKHYVHYPE